MYTKIYWVHDFANGAKLGIMPRPRGDEWLEEKPEIRSLSIAEWGIGRSSIIAGSILLKAGFKTDQILQKITSVRGLKVPDTDQQVQWLKSREKSRS